MVRKVCFTILALIVLLVIAISWFIFSALPKQTEFASSYPGLAAGTALVYDPSGVDSYRFLNGVDLQTSTIDDLHAAMRGGIFSSEELIQQQLSAIKAHDAGGANLNAVARISANAIDEARSADSSDYDKPLSGISILVKDNIHVAGMPSTAGSTLLEQNLIHVSAPVIAQLRQAGAIILGAANLSEWAGFMSSKQPFGYSSLAGQVSNPYDFSISPSGSSSGSAVAATMNFSTLALGSDTAGSCTMPASSTSIVSLRPSVGMVSNEGSIPLAPSMDTICPMGRNVDDVTRLYRVMIDPSSSISKHTRSTDYSLRGKRVGVFPSELSNPLYGALVESLTRQGINVVEINESPGLLLPLKVIDILAAEFKTALNRYLEQRSTVIDLTVESIEDIVAKEESFKYGLPMLKRASESKGSGAENTSYHALRQALNQQVFKWLEESYVAPELDFAIFTTESSMARAVSLTYALALVGWPTLSVPLGFEESTPKGLLLFSPKDTDFELLEAGALIEKSLNARKTPTEINPGLRTTHMARLDGPS